jgi:hypothetical protein
VCGECEKKREKKDGFSETRFFLAKSLIEQKYIFHHNEIVVHFVLRVDIQEVLKGVDVFCLQIGGVISNTLDINFPVSLLRE